MEAHALRPAVRIEPLATEREVESCAIICPHGRDVAQARRVTVVMDVVSHAAKEMCIHSKSLWSGVRSKVLVYELAER